MKCPFCGYFDTKVNDSRPTDDDSKIRRRRECLQCGRRFTTYEVVETAPIMVIKKDGSHELFDRTKLLNGLLRACEKRRISVERLEKAVDSIEQGILNAMKREVSSTEIGTRALEELRRIDEVSYIRFASVYREFQDIDSFLNELDALKRSE